ncbi:MAG: PHP domain-containing protein [Erysipelotrichaceae bacterium]|nr:PHP domain-containing protein [Erysipelotrichaceae bacterium]MDY5252025.1 PHP domain-containing protein [Erysipelotrichaceae bacterium]
MNIDLHVHSNHSFDSTTSIEDILAMAKAKNIAYLAICDHNVVAGSLQAQKQQDIKIIPGIEIDCFFEDKIVHILGLGCDLRDERFAKLEKHYYDELDRIAYERLAKIEKFHQVKLDLAKIKSLSHFDGFSNVEIERVLLMDCDDPYLYPYQKGEKALNPIANYYWDNLAIGKWGYVAMDLPQYVDIINLIHDTNGIAICAHPAVNIQHDDLAIAKLVAAKIDGFEAYCSYHDVQDIAFYEQVIAKYGLVSGCGSDYHGVTKPNIELGQTNCDKDEQMIIERILDRINL